MPRGDGSRWFGNNYAMNLYRGCCHGCIYCDSRSECYRESDFDTVKLKKDALGILEREMAGKRKKGVVGVGSMTDHYHVFEAELEVTRRALMLMDKYGFGAHIITKSDLCVRDIDVFKSIARHSPVNISLTVTTNDERLCAKIERNAPNTGKRFAAMKALSDSGVLCGAVIMPILPMINDSTDNIVNLVRRTAEAGGKYVYGMFGVTLRDRQRSHFYKYLDKDFPGMKEEYIRMFGGEYVCSSPHSEGLMYAMEKECRAAGLVWRMQDIISLMQKNYCVEQISMF